VSSATIVVGRLSVTDQLSFGQAREVLHDIRRHIAAVAVLQDLGNLGHAAMPVTELQDRGAGVVEQNRAFGIEQHMPLADGVEVEASEAPQNRNRRTGYCRVTAPHRRDESYRS